MPFYISYLIDLKVVFASLSGAFVYVLSQHHFERKSHPVIFSVSFVMGIIGADATMELIEFFIPDVFTDGRAIGAFMCSSLLITLVINIMSRIGFIYENKKRNGFHKKS